MSKNIAVIVNEKQFNTVMQNHLTELLNDKEVSLNYLLIDKFNENKIKQNLKK